MTNPKCAYPPCTNVAVAGGGMCRGHRDAYLRRNYPNGYFTDVEPVANHIAACRAAGMTWDQLRAAAGISSWGIRDIVNGRRSSGRVAVHTADAILSVQLPAPGDFTGRPDHAPVPMIGATRRVRALIALGYTNRYIAKHSGYPVEHLHRVISGRAPTLMLKAHRSIAELFTRLETAAPPTGPHALKARRRAAAQGWPLPLAWDLDTIDDPAAEPYVGGSDQAGFVERYEELVDLGYRDNELIADRLGMKLESLERSLYRVGLQPRRIAS